MIKNRYFKTTTGIDQLTFVGNQAAYATEADIEAFQAGATQGELAVYNADTHLLVADDVAPDPLVPVYVALKRGGASETSTPFYVGSGKTRIAKIAYEAPVKHVVTLTFGSTPALAAGDVWEIGIFETTTGNQPFPNWGYQYVAKGADTLANVLTALAAIVNNATLPQNAGNRIVTASSTATTLVLTAIDNGRTFRVVTRQKAWSNLVTNVVTAQFKAGSGTSDQVLLYDAESNVKKGVTTNYPINGVPSEYGIPNNLVVDGGTYVTYVINNLAEEDQSGTPVDRHFRKNYQYIFVPSGSAALIASLDVVFGLVAPV